MRRKQLKEIGFVSSYDSLPYWKAEAFGIIAEEIAALDNAKATGSTKSKKKPGGGRNG